MMRTFIKEHLHKNLQFYIDFYQQKEECGNVDYEHNKKNLMAAYVLLTNGSSSLHLYKGALQEYLDDEKNNKYLKAALNNDLQEMLATCFSKDLLGWFEPANIHGMTKLEHASRVLQNQCFTRIVKLLSVSLPGISIDKNEFPAYLFALESAVANEEATSIIPDLYLLLIKRLNYEMIVPVMEARHAFSRDKRFGLHDLVPKTGSSTLDSLIELDHSKARQAVQKWQSGTLTLFEWQYHFPYDVHELLKRPELGQEDRKNIRAHQRKLFEEAVTMHADPYLTRFDNISPGAEKKELAERDLVLLKNLVEGKINSAEENRLASVFGINHWERLSAQLDALLHSKPLSNEECDIHSENAYLDAKALHCYKKHLEGYPKTIDQEEQKPVAAANGQGPALEAESFTCGKLHTDPQKIRDLLRCLKEENMISGNTKPSEFENILSGEKVETPVLWTGFIGDLKYFIQQLIEKEKVAALKNHWVVANKCFRVAVEEKSAHNGKEKKIKTVKEIDLKSQKIGKSKRQVIEDMVAAL